MRMNHRMWIATALMCAVAAPAGAQALTERIGHTDPAKMRELSDVHGGAGTMRFTRVLGGDALSTNLIFIDAGIIAPKGGIGQHFHNQCEEMFVILDGEAEFTIDGRTSRIAAPAGAPDLMGHSHAIYNPTDKPLKWLNINVGMNKRYDNFDLGDDRVGAAIDKVPQFITMRLDRALLKPMADNPGGRGEVRYRRVLGPVIFSTPWTYVDHVVLAPGAALGTRTQATMSEVYYVVGGTGEATVAGETVPIAVGDAVPVDLAQARAIRSTGAAPLELMVIGVAKDLAAKADYAAATAPRRN
jgi:mannose-6-phosphate isomerase-like protein (cupin superfamily)